MALSTVLLFAGALFIAAGTPGPSVAALVTRVLARGARSVVPFLVAMWVGEAVWLVCAVAGVAAAVRTIGWAFLVLRYVGVAYLIFLAWRMWHAGDEPPSEVLPDRTGFWAMFGTGLALTLGNPKIALFYVALLPTIVDLRAVTILSSVELVATMLVVLMIVDLTWTMLAAKARTFLRSRRAVRAANRGSAAIMATAAAVIAAN